MPKPRLEACGSGGLRINSDYLWFLKAYPIDVFALAEIPPNETVDSLSTADTPGGASQLVIAHLFLTTRLTWP